MKTDSGVMGYSGDSVVRGSCGTGGHPLKTIADHVKQKGKKVGVVTTARVTHATPAAVYAKSEERSWEGSAPEGCTGKNKGKQESHENASQFLLCGEFCCVVKKMKTKN